MQDELKAMMQVTSAIEPLDASARERVLGWVVGALGIQNLTRAERGLAADKGAASVDPVAMHVISESRSAKCTSTIDDWLFGELDYSPDTRVK